MRTRQCLPRGATPADAREPLRGRLMRLIAALVAVSLAAAACSSSPGSSAPSAASGSAAKGTPIKIGLICSCSGAFGTNIEAGAQAAQAWAKTVNASGGINGHPVDLTVDDDTSNPGTSVSDAQAMISSHVAAILDLTILDSAWTKQADAAKIPVIGGNLNSLQFFQDPNWYAAGGTNDSTVAAMVATAKLAKATSMGVVYCAEAPQCAEIVAPTKALAVKEGISVPYTTAVSATAPNYTAQCLAAKQKNVAALFFAGSESVLSHLAQNCAQQNYNPAYLEDGTGFGLAEASSPGLKDNLWLEFPILPFFANQPPVQQLNAAMNKYYPGVQTNGTAWTGFAAQAWTAGLLIAQAVKSAGVPATGTVTAAALTKGLDSISNQTLGGWTPPLTFTAGKPHPIDCWYTARLQNGAAVVANGGKMTCMNG
jgi:branched-chain amino acid transport system substrate-binding protein